MALCLLMAGCAAPAAQEPTVIPTRSPTLTAVPTEIATPTALPTTPAATGRDAATFIRETYPNYSVVALDEKFVKTWEVKNVGTSAWNTTYTLALDST
ncbi:MAG: hypothetical protein IMZ62_16815, partial [Chloroflexi bacterium]|nr:hypothetical protein [Chloroflexota bacterium]